MDENTKGSLLALNEEQWFATLLEDCQAIIVETEFNSRWALVEGYHGLGKRILEEQPSFSRNKIGKMESLQGLANMLGKSLRTIYYAVEFAKKFPNLSALPEGKNTSWNKVCTELLPQLAGADAADPVCDICKQHNWPKEEPGRKTPMIRLLPPNGENGEVYYLHRPCLWSKLIAIVT